MATRNQNITNLLTQFYQKPVAQVSSELFFSIVAVIIFAMFAIRPTLLTMSDLIKEMDDKEALNQALTEKIAALSSAQASYVNNQDKLLLLDEAIPPTPKLAEALTIIEKIASENNLLITTLQATEFPLEHTVAVSTAPKVRMSKSVIVVVQGNYPTIRKFVTDLQNIRRVLSVDSVVFNLTDAQGQKALQATITVNVQYFGNS